jgi:hypothetical protein
MGVSTDAILVFGFSCGEEGSEENETVQALYEDEDGWEKIVRFERRTGAEIIEHCSTGCPMYVIGVKSREANRGYPVAIDPAKLKATKKDLESIHALCEAVGVKFDAKKCKWWLCSYWSGGDG